MLQKLEWIDADKKKPPPYRLFLGHFLLADGSNHYAVACQPNQAKARYVYDGNQWTDITKARLVQWKPIVFPDEERKG